MSDHLLHLRFDQWGAQFSLTCHHAPDAYPIADEATGEPDPAYAGQCGALDWFMELNFDEIEMEGFPEDPSFPCPVRAASWGEGLVLYHGGVDA